MGKYMLIRLICKQEKTLESGSDSEPFADTDAVALLMMVLGAALRSTRRQSHSNSCNNPGQQGPQGWLLEVNGPFALISSSSS